MAREIFEVTKDRFHLQDPCCYILQGTWPKEAKMRACLDGSEVKAEIKKLEMVSALERFKDPDLMRGRGLQLRFVFRSRWMDFRNFLFMRICRTKLSAGFLFLSGI